MVVGAAVPSLEPVECQCWGELGLRGSGCGEALRAVLRPLIFCDV
jgi:hypothetical protein